MNFKLFFIGIVFFYFFLTTTATVQNAIGAQPKYQSKDLPSLSILSYNIKQLCSEYKLCNATNVHDLLRLDQFNFELITDEKGSAAQFFLSKTMNDFWSIQVNQKRWFVLASDQHFVFDLLNEAKKLVSEKKFTNAIENITQILSLKPDMDQAYFLLAYCNIQQSKLDNFIHNAEKAISLNPNNPEYVNQMAWFYATTKHSKYRNARKALKYALKAISISPDNWIFTDTLAAVYARNGRFHEALDTQNKSIELIRKNGNLTADRIHQNLKKMNQRKKMYQHRKAYTDMQ
ncbi:conserved hypothetical protein, membrane or secreted [Candidatus Magnetomorum sp. HK-1]|nr:conserved hypothetical protein, membrane or secreted [Candidatus Magnetomorum sp. HK-1]